MSGREWQEGYMHCGKKRGTHLTRNLQNSESHFSLTRDTEARNMFYSALTEFLTCLLTLVKGRRVGAGGQYIFQYLDHFYFFYMIILFYSFFSVLYVHKSSFLPWILPKLESSRVIWAFRFAFFSDEYTKFNQNLQIKIPREKNFPCHRRRKKNPKT